MTVELSDTFRIIFLLMVAVPSFAFVGTYLWFLRGMKWSQEAVHLLAFTTLFGVLALSALIREFTGDESAPAAFTFVVMIAAAVLSWHRFVLLLRYLAIPRLRKRRALRRKAKRKEASEQIH